MIKMSRARDGCDALALVFIKLQSFKAGLEAAGVEVSHFGETLSGLRFAKDVMKEMLDDLETMEVSDA